MTELANARTTEIGMKEQLGMQLRAYRMNVDLNLWQMARVLVEAKDKKIVPQGEWRAWLTEYANMGLRSAQDLMAAYRRFEGKLPLEEINRSKVFKLLPLPEEAEEQFLAEHDVREMSTREIQEAVKAAREEALEEAEARVKAAEERARAAEEREPDIPPELLAELERSRQGLDEARAGMAEYAEMARQAAGAQAKAERERDEARAEMAEQDELLKEQQDALNRAQEELLNMKSAQARGEEHVYKDELTLDVFESAVREFIGICARMPHMGSSFCGMDNATINRYFQLVKTVESWAEGARNAIMTVSGGVVVA